MMTISRKGFMKLFAAAPVALFIPMAQEVTGFPVEIQIGDTQFFRPDGFYGAGFEDDWTMRLHYVLDGVTHREYYRYGFWTVGDSGLPRVVVANLS